MTHTAQHIRFAQADGYRIAYARSGSGPVLVKAANYLTHLEHDFTNPAAGPWLAGLSRCHTLIRYDERGTGLSDRNVSDLSFDAWVRDLESVVDTEGLVRFPLLGISQGAAIAIAFAVRFPERVSRLVLYGSFARGRLRRDPTPQQIEEAETLAKLAEIGWGRENPAFRAVFTHQLLPGGTATEHRALDEIQRVSAAPQTAAQIMRLFDRLDVSDLAPQVQCPTLVMHARDDARIPFEEGRRVAGLIPGARFVPLDSRNHLLTLGDPALEQFLQETGRFVLEGDHDPVAGADLVARLSRRERDMLEQLTRGRSNREIADTLGIAEKTVRNHLSRLYDKLGVHTRTAAAAALRGQLPKQSR